jgi:peptidoglycan pentaglycine glycine transferase (the first glycine)
MTVTVRTWDDRDSWNDFVSTTADAHFQQSWEWGELAPELGAATIRLGLLRDERLVGAAQLAITPIRYAGTSYIYVPRGPALHEPRLETLAPLLERARLIGMEAGSAGIRVEPNVHSCSDPWKRSLRALGLHPTHPPSQPRSSWLLDITPDEDRLLAQMKQKTRYNIRLAARKGVEVVEGGTDDLDSFYSLYCETAERDDFAIQSKQYYRRMFSIFEPSGMFCLLLAMHAGEMIAAVTLIRFGSTCWYLHGVSSNRHRNLMATYLLQWEAIRRAKGWGCSLYDFRAVPDTLREDQDMYGVYRFKEGFGGRHFTALPTYTAAYRPVVFNLWQLFYRSRFELTAWQRRRQGLPARQFA